MKKTVVAILVVIALILALVVAGVLGYLWYQNNHVFIEDAVYPMDAEGFDLRSEDISFDHYNSLKRQLPNCYILWNVPFQDGKLPNDTREIAISQLTLEDIDILMEYFPQLERVDASACSDYGILEILRVQMPQIQVAYTVTLGGKSFPPDVTELVLEPGEYTLDGLMKTLVYLPHVQTIQLKTPELTQEEIEGLRAAYPKIGISCTVEILGQEYDMETTTLDLSTLTSDQVAEVAGKLAMLPGLTKVDLTGNNLVSPLSKADAKLLMDAAPNVVFDYQFDFFGEVLSTADNAVHIKNKKIGDKGEAELRLTLDLMTNCQRFVLEYCQISNDILAKIRDDYRDRTKIVWRVNFGQGSALTDSTIIRAVYDLVDDNCHNLVYCEDAQFMDLGHNEWLDACDFIAGMPNLEAVILSGSPIKSLEPFRNCKKLKFLEVAFCEYLEDASPLAQCTSLEMLNISNTHIVDLSPLDKLPLKTLVARMWTSSNTGIDSRVSVEEQERFIAAQPDCQSYFNDHKNPYGAGWRYVKDGGEYLDYYAQLRDIFQYDQDPNIPNHVGWYWQEPEKTTTKK